LPSVSPLPLYLLFPPSCSSPFVLRLVLPRLTCCCNETCLFPTPNTHSPALSHYNNYQLLPARHAPCCHPPHSRHHGPLDIHQTTRITKQCSATARMGDQQCHVKSISSGQCNTAAPASAFLLWHIYTANCPPTTTTFAFAKCPLGLQRRTIRRLDCRRHRCEAAEPGTNGVGRCTRRDRGG
jgi:hypothetical protein